MSVTVYKGNLSPSLSDTIKINGVAANLAGATVKLKARLETSSTLKVNAAATITDAPNGAVRYDWVAGDVDTAGEYLAWWEVTFAGPKVQETPQFSLVIADPVALTEPAAYANVTDVQARAGRLADAWTAQSKPSLSDIDLFIRTAAAEIDAAISSHGVGTPVTAGSVAALALRGLNADGALCLALNATWTEDSGPGSALDAKKVVCQRWSDGIAALLAGKSPVIATLVEGNADTLAATAFWLQEPGYGFWPLTPFTTGSQRWPWGDGDLNPWIAPEFARGQSL